VGATRRIGTRRRNPNRNHDKEEMQNVWSKIADPAAACLIAWLAACLAYCLSYSILPGEAFAFWGRVVRRAAERGGLADAPCQAVGRMRFLHGFLGRLRLRRCRRA
jgi:hypothetical protein